MPTRMKYQDLKIFEDEIDIFILNRPLEARLCLETSLYYHYFGEGENTRVQ